MRANMVSSGIGVWEDNPIRVSKRQITKSRVGHVNDLSSGPRLLEPIVLFWGDGRGAVT